MAKSIGGLIFDITASTEQFERQMERVSGINERVKNQEIANAQARAREERKMQDLREEIDAKRKASDALEAEAAKASISREKEIRRELSKIGAEIERLQAAEKKLAEASQTAEVERLGRLQKIRNELGTQAKKLDSIKAAGNKVKDALKGAGGALLAGVSVGAAKSFIDSLDGLAKRARDIGMTASQLQELGHQAKLAGVDAGQLDTSIKSFNRNISQASMDTGEAKAALQSMGISLQDSNGLVKSQSDLLKEVATYFSENAGEAENAARATKLFGDNGAEMLRVFEDGGPEAIEQIFNAKGIDAAAESAERFNSLLERMKNNAYQAGAMIVEGWGHIADLTQDIGKGIYNSVSKGSAKELLKSFGSTEYERAQKELNERTRKQFAAQAAAQEAARKREAEAERKAVEDYKKAAAEYEKLNAPALSAREQYLKITEQIKELDSQPTAGYAEAAEKQKQINALVKEQLSLKKAVDAEDERERKAAEDAEKAERKSVEDYKKAMGDFNKITSGEVSARQQYSDIARQIAEIQARETHNYDEAAQKQNEINALLKEQMTLKKGIDAQSQSRKEFELQTQISVLRAQGRTAEADQLEFAKQRNELMAKYGYSIEEATRAQKTLNELNKAQNGGNIDSDMQKRAKSILERGKGGTIGKKTLEEAQAAAEGRTPEGGFKTAMFKDYNKTDTKFKNINVDAKAAKNNLDNEAKNLEEQSVEKLGSIEGTLTAMNNMITDIKNSVDAVATKSK